VINGNLVGPLVHLMRTAECAVRNEAAWAISNATSGGTHDQINILKVCLEGLVNVLKVGEAEKSLGACHANMYAHMIEDADALDKIEDLQNHDDDMIYQMATFLLETFWVEEDDVMPSEGNAPPDGFNFG